MSDNTVDNQKSKLKAFLLPILIVVVIAIILSTLTLNYYASSFINEPPEDLSPFPENPEDPGGIVSGAILNTLFYVVFIFIAGFITLLIFKKGLLQFLTYFFAAAMGISWFSFGYFFGLVFTINILDFLTPWLDYIDGFLVFVFNVPFVIFSVTFSVFEIILLLFGIFLGILGTFSFASQSLNKLWLRNGMMLIFGPMIGSMLAIHFGLLTVFLILIGLSLYDIYAVFYGPLKGIIDQSREDSKEIEEKLERNEIDPSEVVTGALMPALPVYSTSLINIGLGDFAFFSMLVSAAVIISYGLSTPIPLLMAVLGLLTGAYYTFQFLKEERALPGLPLPIFGGIATMIIGILIVMVIDGVTLDAILGLF